MYISVGINISNAYQIKYKDPKMENLEELLEKKLRKAKKQNKECIRYEGSLGRAPALYKDTYKFLSAASSLIPPQKEKEERASDTSLDSPIEFKSSVFRLDDITVYNNKMFDGVDYRRYIVITENNKEVLKADWAYYHSQGALLIEIYNFVAGRWFYKLKTKAFGLV